MENEEDKRSIILNGVAKALNVTGTAIVVSFDSSVDLIGKAVSKVKTADFSLPKVSLPKVSFPKVSFDFLGGTKNIFSGKLRLFKPVEEKDIEARIREYEDKIKAAYYEIGKVGSTADELESEKVTKLINDVKEYEKEIERLKTRADEIDESKEDYSKREVTRKKKVKVPQVRVISAVSSAIEKAVRQGDFETDSDRAIFDKIANDFLDSEIEIKILAASELGKIGNKIAVPVLHEAIQFDNPYLTTEIVNALINLGDPTSIELFKDTAGDNNYRVRMVSLRGLYKIGDDKEIMPYLVAALKDKHPEVRKTAATFIGWKDYPDAVPALVQTLQDKDERVRKSAVTALSNLKEPASVLPLMRLLADSSLDIRETSLKAIKTITGEDIKFDVELSGKTLSEAIEKLKESYHDERLSKFEVDSAAMDITEDDDTYGSSGLAADFAEEEAETAEMANTVTATAEEEEETAEMAEANTQAEEEEEAPQSEMSAVTEAEQDSLSAEFEEAVADEEYSADQLKKMTKTELLEICTKREIEAGTNMTKSEIIDLILK